MLMTKRKDKVLFLWWGSDVRHARRRACVGWRAPWDANHRVVYAVASNIVPQTSAVLEVVMGNVLASMLERMSVLQA